MKGFLVLALLVFTVTSQQVRLGTASNFAVLAGSTITNTGPTTISGDVGLHPGTAIVPGPWTVAGAIHSANGVALQAKSDLVVAYNDAAGRARTATVGGELGGRTLVAGVYFRGSSLGLTGTVTLDGPGIYIFQIGSTLTTASSSVVRLINGANPCNVFWQVGSSATLGTNSVFVGTILALTSITATTGVNIEGQLLARNGAVTLDTNVITATSCRASSPGPSPGPGPAPGGPGGSGGNGGGGNGGGGGGGRSDGSDGHDGKDGHDGRDGKDDKDVGNDGKDGSDGRDGNDGRDGRDGKDSKDGNDDHDRHPKPPAPMPYPAPQPAPAPVAYPVPAPRPAPTPVPVPYPAPAPQPAPSYPPAQTTPAPPSPQPVPYPAAPTLPPRPYP